MPFDLKRLLHAVTSISQDGLHGLTGCIWKHLTQGVQLSAWRQKKEINREGINKDASFEAGGKLEREKAAC